MKITITDGNSVSNFQVDQDQMIQDIKALIEMGIPIQRSQLYYQGKLLSNSTRLNQAGVTEDGLLFLAMSNYQQVINQNKTNKNQYKQTNKKGFGIAQMIKNFDKQVKQTGNVHTNFQTISNQEYIRQAQNIYKQISADENRKHTLRSTDPQIAECIDKNDIKGLANILQKKRQQKLKKLMDQQRKFMQLSKDPMNPQYQRMLQQRIHQQNVDKNLQFAQQYIPQVFGHIHMLYINANINKIPIQAFVDSGAQSTIMSVLLAEKCGLMRLVDKRYAGTAVGVGQCKILGKIHAADIQIEGKFLTCSFTVIENNSVEFLLGLDMLKRFSCLIDLKKNVLNFQDGLIVTKFLSDGQISKNCHPTKKQDIQNKLKKLTSMGFTKQQSLAALQNCNYNEQVAGNMLMQRKYGK